MIHERTFSLRCGDKNYSVRVPDGVRFQYATLNHTEKVSDPAARIREALAKFDDPFLLILSEGGEIIPMLEA